MYWTVLFLAGLFEIAWAVGLKYTEGFTRLVPSVLTGAAMVVSIVLLAIATKKLPWEPPMQCGPVSVPWVP